MPIAEIPQGKGAQSLDTIYETTNINFKIEILSSKVNTRLQLKIFVLTSYCFEV